MLTSLVNDQQAKEILNQFGNSLELPEKNGNVRLDIKFPSHLLKFKGAKKCMIARVGQNSIKFMFS